MRNDDDDANTPLLGKLGHKHFSMLMSDSDKLLPVGTNQVPATGAFKTDYSEGMAKMFKVFTILT